ncbi:MAG: hypothetical protein WBF62_06660, partial [Bradyrhizobium sp.]
WGSNARRIVKRSRRRLFAKLLQTIAQKENARGERAFSKDQLGGKLGFHLSTWRFGGLIKRRVNS